MKSLSLLFLLVASGACDDVKYISKRNSGRMNLLSVAPCCSFLGVSNGGLNIGRNDMVPISARYG